MHHRAKFHQNWSNSCGYIAIFKMVAVHHPDILGRIWTTYEGYLVVFIIVQNLVVINAVVLKILMSQYLVCLA